MDLLHLTALVLTVVGCLIGAAVILLCAGVLLGALQQLNEDVDGYHPSRPDAHR